MASWHQAQRMQLERVHLQGSLIDDPPVLIPATTLREVTNGGSAASLPFTTDLPPAVHIGAGDQAPAVPGTAYASEGRPGFVTTNDNGRVGSPVRASADAATGGSF